MAKAGKDIEIVTDLENVNVFSDFVEAKKGLIVCETYQEWAGPCVVMKRFLKKAKFEYLEGDDWDIVHYCSIKVEAVPAFKNLRGKCIPTYIFFGGKKPIGIFRGYEPSLLMPLIKEMCLREKLYMAGKAVRPTLSDVLPYVFPEEDPVLTEVEILETPLAKVDELPLFLLKGVPSSATSVVDEASGIGLPIAVSTVNPSQTDITGNKSAARAAVGQSPISTDNAAAAANPIVSPTDQAVGNANAAGGTVPGITKPVAPAGQAPVAAATLPDPKPGEAASAKPPTEPTSTA